MEIKLNVRDDEHATVVGIDDTPQLSHLSSYRNPRLQWLESVNIEV
jgi:hypothetical protein